MAEEELSEKSINLRKTIAKEIAEQSVEKKTE